MAESNPSQQLDLNQILQNLANLTPATYQGQQQPSLPPPQPLPQHPPQQYQQPPSRLQPSPRPAAPRVDSSTITEWKHAIRCVNKLAAQNPGFEASIQKLIKDQQRNVRDWANGRQRLIEEQRGKRENEKTQRAAISLPGLLDNAPLLRTDERDKEELDQYDQKVYRACRQMTESHNNELKRLGVPFFTLRSNLLRADSTDSPSSSGDTDAKTEDKTPAADGTITTKQHLELQRKMLNHLVDLYGE